MRKTYTDEQRKTAKRYSNKLYYMKSKAKRLTSSYQSLKRQSQMIYDAAYDDALTEVMEEHKADNRITLQSIRNKLFRIIETYDYAAEIGSDAPEAFDDDNYYNADFRDVLKRAQRDDLAKDICEALGIDWDQYNEDLESDILSKMELDGYNASQQSLKRAEDQLSDLIKEIGDVEDQYKAWRMSVLGK